MSDNQLLDLTVVTFTPTELGIKVKNRSGGALDKTITMMLTPPMYLVDHRVQKAAESAATDSEFGSMASLAGIVTAAPGWSVWAIAEPTGDIATIHVYNDTDQQTGKLLNKPFTFAAGAEFTLRIPLDPAANRDSIKLPYTYEYDKKESTAQVGELELKSVDTGEWEPKVTLKSNQDSPTAIDPKSEVIISWEIEDGVSATLRGPLPGGNSERELSSKPEANYKIAAGSIEILATGPMTYLLQAEVRRPDGLPNVQVTRMLWLDTKDKKDKYLRARPRRVLLNGLVEVDWAAWGVDEVYLYVGSEASRRIRLTKQNLSRYFQGSGIMRFNARAAKFETITLQTATSGIMGDAIDTKVDVISWEKSSTSNFTGTPLGLAVAAPKMALLTSDGLWTANVGIQDPPPTRLSFTRVTKDTPKAWLALAALDEKFVVLRQTSQDGLQVALYGSDGQPDEVPPVDLPGDLQGLVRQSGTVYDFAAFGGRVYLVVEAFISGVTARRAYSLRFANKKAEQRPEPRLEPLPGYRLVTFAGGLYALHRNTGRMFRFELTPEGKLEQPYQAASAVDNSETAQHRGQSMIRQGLLVPVGRVLTVLCPSSVPSLEALKPFGLLNVLIYEKLGESEDPETIPQDLVYNPQKDYWARCGHDLEIQKGAVAAFRDNDSSRLWVVQPNGNIHTLSVGSEHLFAVDYIGTFPPKTLSPFLDTQRTFTFETTSRIHLIPLGDTSQSAPPAAPYLKAGLSAFSATGMAELVSPLKPILPGDSETPRTTAVEFKYNKADPAPITLRYLVKRNLGSGTRTDVDYMLEVTFSGPDLSSATSVFKRIGVDGQGHLVSDDVHNTRTQHSTYGPIKLQRPSQFDQDIQVFIVNASPYSLKTHGLTFASTYVSAKSSTYFGMKYDFPDFTLTFDPREEPSGSELRVNVNFAKPHGIEVSSSNQPQKSLMRLDTDKAKTLNLMLAKLVQPGDPPLQLEGSRTPIAATNWMAYVIQIGHRK